MFSCPRRCVVSFGRRGAIVKTYRALPTCLRSEIGEGDSACCTCKYHLLHWLLSRGCTCASSLLDGTPSERDAMTRDPFVLGAHPPLPSSYRPSSRARAAHELDGALRCGTSWPRAATARGERRVVAPADRMSRRRTHAPLHPPPRSPRSHPPPRSPRSPPPPRSHRRGLRRQRRETCGPLTSTGGGRTWSRTTTAWASPAPSGSSPPSPPSAP